MSMGKHLGQAVASEQDMFPTGHLFDVYEHGVDHAEACPCVDFVLPRAS
jgi:hypothetical protein